MDSQEDNEFYFILILVLIFMNSFNAVHVFTELLKWRDHINNANLLQ